MRTKKLLRAGNVCMQRFWRVPAHYLQSGWRFCTEISISVSTASHATLQLINSECDQVRFAGLSSTCRSTPLLPIGEHWNWVMRTVVEENVDSDVFLCVTGGSRHCNPIKTLLLPARNGQIQHAIKTQWLNGSTKRPRSKLQLTAELFFFRQHVCFILQISKTTCERELTANQFYSAGR